MTRVDGPVIAWTMSNIVPPSPASDTLPDGAIPAATLVIMRASEDGGPDEILMVKRSSTMAFAAGAVVFPGGRVDPDDYLVARQHAPDLDAADGAARAVEEGTKASRLVKVEEGERVVAVVQASQRNP